MATLQGSLSAQVTGARILPGADSILIGDQPLLTIELDVPQGSRVHWPEFSGDTITAGIEILDRGTVDTTVHENGYMTLRQSHRITSFDPGDHVIDPIPFEFTLPDDTTSYRVQSGPAFLTVTSPEVDMQGDIKPIKPPLPAPVTLAEILPWILLGLAILAAVLLVIYVIRKRKEKGPVFPVLKKPSVPAHVRALEALEELGRMKLWQSGRTKEFYTQLTDIVRWYIEERYRIPAPEMTTEEISFRIRSTGANTEVTRKLHDTLTLADLVKFAKEQPLPVENDISLNNCIDFVKETRPVPEPARNINEETVEKEKL